MIVKLSYNLSEHMPFIEGLPQPKLAPLRDFSMGDEWRSFYFTTNNHMGTHVDAPNHFCPGGRKITDYRIEELIFERPAIFSIAVGEAQLIMPEHFVNIQNVGRDCDCLLLKTGFAKFRSSHPKLYGNCSPGFSRASAEYLMEALPGLKALVIDIISIASSVHAEHGVEAHKAFLGYPCHGQRSILLVEDALVPDDLTSPQRVYVVPLYFEGLDSAPCTVFAEA